jgi:hypothetical protein
MEKFCKVNKYNKIEKKTNARTVINYIVINNSKIVNEVSEVSIENLNPEELNNVATKEIIV